MVREESIAYTEVLNILKKSDPQYVSKIPIEIIKFLTENALDDELYDYPGLDEDGNIKCSKQAIMLLDYLIIEYLSDEQGKELILNFYKENDKINSEKYNTSNIFERDDVPSCLSQSTINTSNSSALVEKPTNFIKKIINKLKNIFLK